MLIEFFVWATDDDDDDDDNDDDLFLSLTFRDRQGRPHPPKTAEPGQYL